MREKIGAMATAQSDAKAREAIAAVRQLRDVVRDGDPRALAAKLAAAARQPRRTAPPASPVTAPVAAPPASAPVAAPAPVPPDMTDDTAGDGTLQTDDATAGSATLAEVYEELGETDFDALETALRKCDADE